MLTLASGQEVRGDHLLVGTGRRPRMPDGLAAAGATFDAHGIKVDERLRSSAPRCPSGAWSARPTSPRWLCTS